MTEINDIIHFMREKLDSPARLEKGCLCGECWEPRCIFLEDVIAELLNYHDISGIKILRHSENTLTFFLLDSNLIHWDVGYSFERQIPNTQLMIAKFLGYKFKGENDEKSS